MQHICNIELVCDSMNTVNQSVLMFNGTNAGALF